MLLATIILQLEVQHETGLKLLYCIVLYITFDETVLQA